MFNFDGYKFKEELDPDPEVQTSNQIRIRPFG